MAWGVWRSLRAKGPAGQQTGSQVEQPTTCPDSSESSWAHLPMPVDDLGGWLTGVAPAGVGTLKVLVAE